MIARLAKAEGMENAYCAAALKLLDPSFLE
jgi:hypothetical protein